VTVLRLIAVFDCAVSVLLVAWPIVTASDIREFNGDVREGIIIRFSMLIHHPEKKLETWRSLKAAIDTLEDSRLLPKPVVYDPPVVTIFDSIPQLTPGPALAVVVMLVYPLPAVRVKDAPPTC
jgi:hypothetical protein